MTYNALMQNIGKRSPFIRIAYHFSEQEEGGSDEARQIKIKRYGKTRMKERCTERERQKESARERKQRKEQEKKEEKD